MRLLSFDDHGEARLMEFSDIIPPYAILSHTWGNDGEEFTYRDVMEGTGKDKFGYQKIKLCGTQAAKHGLSYFWVDTCCIDKSDYAELQYSLNSMFRWYRQSAKCYIYLTDVTTNGPTGEVTD